MTLPFDIDLNEGPRGDGESSAASLIERCRTQTRLMGLPYMPTLTPLAPPLA